MFFLRKAIAQSLDCGVAPFVTAGGLSH